MLNKNISYRTVVPKKGIAVLEVMVIVIIILIGVTIAIPLVLNKPNLNRRNETIQKILSIKSAIIGNFSKIVEKNRTSFGFLGDLGILPGSLDELLTIGSYQTFQVVNNIGFGWKGPYLEPSALIDSWGNSFQYSTTITGSDSNGIYAAQILSTGDPGLSNDNISQIIYQHEIKTYVNGYFKDRLQNPITQNQVTVTFPDGTANLKTVLITTSSPNTAFNSLTDTVSDLNNRQIPLGLRLFETSDLNLKKIVSLNRGQNFSVNFISTQSEQEAFFERSFDSTDNPSENSLQNLMGSWTIENGNLHSTGSGENRLVFGDSSWKDYRVEVDATLHSGNGYGIYYRTNGEQNITGYIFQFDPELYDSGVEFVIRKVVNGDENYFPESQRFLIRNIRYTTSQFFNTFGSNIYNDSHRISITVLADRHIVKVDGIKIIDITDTEPLFPCNGLCGKPGFRTWHDESQTDFHHLLVHSIPPLPTHENVWWSFEEGNGKNVYGSGFEIDNAEINGTIQDISEVYRQFNSDNIHGQAVHFSGNSDNYIDFGNVLNYRPTDQFTITALFKLTNLNVNKIYTIISKIKDQGSEKGWNLSLQKNNPNDFGVEFKLFSNAKNNILKRISTTAILENKWYFVAVSYAGKNNTITPVPPEILQIYLTCLEETSLLSPSNSTISQSLKTNANSTSNSSMIIGSNKNGTDLFEGLLDEIRIYKKALTYDELTSIFSDYK